MLQNSLLKDLKPSTWKKSAIASGVSGETAGVVAIGDADVACLCASIVLCSGKAAVSVL